MKSLLEVIRPVGSKLRDAWLHEKMTLYHRICEVTTRNFSKDA